MDPIPDCSPHRVPPLPVGCVSSRARWMRSRLWTRPHAACESKPSPSPSLFLLTALQSDWSPLRSWSRTFARPSPSPSRLLLGLRVPAVPRPSWSLPCLSCLRSPTPSCHFRASPSSKALTAVLGDFISLCCFSHRT